MDLHFDDYSERYLEKSNYRGNEKLFSAEECKNSFSKVEESITARGQIALGC